MDDSKTPADYLDKFYSDYHLGEDGGNKLPYVVIEFFKYFRVYIPNWNDRRKAVLRHDIHHILTGYKSIMTGEFQIAAWEIGSGCMNYKAAYLLNSGGLLLGILLYFLPSFRAFILGCRTSNLYQIELSDTELKNTPIGDLKKKIRLTKNVHSFNPKFSEIAKLIFHCALGVVLNFFALFLIPWILLYNLWIYGKKLSNF